MWLQNPKLDPLKINIGTKDELEILGFTPDRNRKIITGILCFLTGGLLLLLLSWKPSIRLKFTHLPCQSKEAKVLLVTDIYGQTWEEEILEETLILEDRKFTKRKYFYNKKIKYFWDEDFSLFTRVSYPKEGTIMSDFPNLKRGLTSSDVQQRQQIFGENKIKIESQTIWDLFIRQAYNPFYIFQAYTIIFWCLQSYYVYSACIFLLSAISIAMNIWETKRQTKMLKEKMITSSQVQVLRDGNVRVLDSSELVPGDVVLLQAGENLLEADMVLLDGSIIMNEAILTGESVPVTKIHATDDDEEIFDPERHKRYILHGGTQVLQVRGGTQLRALVVKTGFSTVKGEMIRSILFPKPIDFRIYSDFLKLIFIFLLLGIGAMIWSLVHWNRNEMVSWKTATFNSLDLMTFVIPPIIPATITAINMWAQKRLKKLKIFCLSSNYISLAGPVDVVCFDKTGTLTEDDLSMEGIVPCEDGEFQPPMHDLTTISEDSPLSRALASCHSVAIADDGKLIGHPLDIKIFCAIGWKILQTIEDESKEHWETEPLFVVKPQRTNSSMIANSHDYAILKTYPFESGDQRMTVIARKRNGGHYEIFMKGAPEKIASLCNQETVPSSFDLVLDWYARQGLRVIAAAYSTLHPTMQWKQISNISRDSLEHKSTFLGLIVLQNRLKAETIPVLDILHQASISTIMITGDNLLTATSVARQCGLVKDTQQLIFVEAIYVPTSAKAVQHLQINFHDSQQNSGVLTKGFLKSVVHPDYVFGINGDSFQLIAEFEPETLKKIIHRGKVFARMKPDLKIEVVEALQKLGHQVAMCGDGCNDCGALKAAHAGISLSSTESSVAAPFTSLQQDIGCVVNLIREGRATLISTYASFKYNISYCFSLLIVVLFMFTVYTEPSDTQYLIMDLVLITIPSLMLGNTGASKDLCQKRPSRRILHPIHIISILSFLGFQAIMYWGTWSYMEGQSWYVPYNLTGEYHEATYEGTILITESFYTFHIGAIIFSHSFPFRKPIYTNKILFAYLIFSMALCMFFTFCKANWLTNFLNFKATPYDGFTVTIFLSIVLVALICYIWEQWVLYGVVEDKLVPWLLKCYGPRQPYEKLEKTLRSSTSSWPKLSDHSLNLSRRQREGSEQTTPEECDDPHEKIFRKSTKRRFRSDVKYIDEVKTVKPTKIICRTDSNDTENNYGSKTVFKDDFADYDYAEPINSGQLPESRIHSGQLPGGGLTIRDQHSFRTQLLNGRSDGLLRTFQRNIDKKTIQEAEPYEVVPLQYTEESHPQKENIYSSIENMHEGDFHIVSTPLINDQSKNTGRSSASSEVSIGGSTKSTVAEGDVQRPMVDIEEPQEISFKKKLANPSVDAASKEGLSLIKEMNQDWAILRSSLNESMKDFSVNVNKNEKENELQNTTFTD